MNEKNYSPGRIKKSGILILEAYEFPPLSDVMVRGKALREMNLHSAFRNESVSRLSNISICTARVVTQVNKHFSHPSCLSNIVLGFGREYISSPYD